MIKKTNQVTQGIKILFLIVVVAFGLLFYLKYKTIETHQDNNKYIFVDKTRSFSVEFPLDWYSNTPSGGAIVGAPVSDLGRSSCSSTIEQCLKDIISSKTINIHRDVSLSNIAKKELGNEDGRMVEISLGDGTPAVLVDNISQGNAIRLIYFRNVEENNNVTEVKLLNVGMDDQKQFISTFKRLREQTYNNDTEIQKARTNLSINIANISGTTIIFNDSSSSLDVYFGSSKNTDLEGGISIAVENYSPPKLESAKTVNEYFRMVEYLNNKAGKLPETPGFPALEEIRQPSFIFINQTGVETKVLGDIGYTKAMSNGGEALRYWALVPRKLIQAVVSYPKDYLAKKTQIDSKIVQVLKSIRYISQ